jgi:putative membrane protein insertion efficiency factor
VPKLRQSLKRPETYLILLGIVLISLVLDTFRDPAGQLTGQFYVRGVRFYQVLGRPLLRGHIMCRYHPTCSAYSIEAVKQYGLRQGLVLTLHRLASCTTDVDPGTFNPVPSSG